MSIEHSQILARFFAPFYYILFPGRSGPGPLGLVRIILVVRSGNEGPQFDRSVGTLQSARLGKFLIELITIKSLIVL